MGRESICWQSRVNNSYKIVALEYLSNFNPFHNIILIGKELITTQVSLISKHENT